MSPSVAGEHMAEEFQVVYRRAGWLQNQSRRYATRLAAEGFIFDKLLSDNRPDLAPIHHLELRRRPVARTWHHDTTFVRGGRRWQ